jgi:hypothetical protein
MSNYERDEARASSTSSEKRMVGSEKRIETFWIEEAAHTHHVRQHPAKAGCFNPSVSRPVIERRYRLPKLFRF